MPVSESQKSASAKWDREHMAHLSCKVTKEKAERFRTACRKLGTTANAVFQRAVDRTIEEAEDQEES